MQMSKPFRAGRSMEVKVEDFLNMRSCCSQIGFGGARGATGMACFTPRASLIPRAFRRIGRFGDGMRHGLLVIRLILRVEPMEERRGAHSIAVVHAERPRLLTPRRCAVRTTRKGLDRLVLKRDRLVRSPVTESPMTIAPSAPLVRSSVWPRPFQNQKSEYSTRETI